MKRLEQKSHAVTGITVTFNSQELIILADTCDELANEATKEAAIKNLQHLLKTIVGDIKGLGATKKELFNIIEETKVPFNDNPIGYGLPKVIGKINLD